MTTQTVDGKLRRYGNNDGSIGWILIERGRYQAVLMPELGQWTLERHPRDPDAGWEHSGWYLFGPRCFGKLMHDRDGDGRLDAAIDAANEHLMRVLP